MALFGNKTKKSAQGGSASGGKTEAKVSGPVRDLSDILSHARITEKATMNQGASVYTFDISSRATKRDIIRAVFQLYKVTPRAVRVVSIPMKKVRHAKSGKLGMKGGGKKAYVYLKKGETITIA